MANSVKIEVELDEKGAVKSVKKLESSIDDVKQADKGLDWDGVKEGRQEFDGTAKSARGLEDGIGSLSDMLGQLSGAAASALGLSAFADYALQSSDASARLSATLAGTSADAEAFNDAMLSIYKNNYGESLDDIAEAANGVIQIVGKDITPEALESITSSAIVLRDTFGFDVAESVKAAQVMMRNFGISSEEAFDILARGAQEGLNINGDMLDSFSEYSPYFAQLGLDATDMFNAMKAGADISMYGVDKAGDAFKEFGIRVVDGSASTQEAFDAMGLSAEEYARKVMAGGDSAAQATSEIIAALLAIEDPVERNRQGVALFGTQWEDLGQDGAEAMLRLMGQAVECEGALAAIDGVRYDNAGDAVGAIGRAFETSLMQPLVGAIMPALSDFAAWFTENQAVVVPVVGGIAAAFGVLAGAMAISGLINTLSAAFAALNVAMLANPAVLIAALIVGLVAAIVALWSNCEEFRNFWIGLWENIEGAVSQAVASASGFFEDMLSTVSTTFEGIKNAVASKIQEACSVASAVVSTIRSVFSSVFGSILGTVSSIFAGIRNAITQPMETAKGIVGGIVDAIKGFFNFRISWPHIPMPHFSINPPGWQIGDLLKGSIPSLGINWYATGGVFNGPSVIGIGEDGTEGVVPFDERGARPLAKGIADEMGDAELMADILRELRALRRELPKMMERYRVRDLKVDGRAFARLVVDTEGLY